MKIALVIVLSFIAISGCGYIFYYNSREQTILRFHQACMHGDMNSVRRMVAGRPYLVSSRDTLGWPAIFNAGRKDQFAVMTFLLAHGADLNAIGSARVALVHFTMYSGDMRLLTFLLTHNADVNMRDGLGATPLHYAAECGRVAFAQKLIEHGASINAQDNSGQTPLHVARQRRNNDVVRLLLSHGADTKILDEFGKTPSDYAVEH